MSRRHLFLGFCGCLALAVVAGLRAAPQHSFANPHAHSGSREHGDGAPAAGARPVAGVDRTAWLMAELARAPEGGTIDVPAGVYRGPFVIDRTLRLHAAGAAHLVGDGRTHTVAILVMRRWPTTDIRTSVA